jgi:hypothetical protein
MHPVGRTPHIRPLTQKLITQQQKSQGDDISIEIHRQ